MTNPIDHTLEALKREHTECVTHLAELKGEDDPWGWHRQAKPDCESCHIIARLEAQKAEGAGMDFIDEFEAQMSHLKIGGEPLDFWDKTLTQQFIADVRNRLTSQPATDSSTAGDLIGKELHQQPDDLCMKAWGEFEARHGHDDGEQSQFGLFVDGWMHRDRLALAGAPVQGTVSNALVIEVDSLLKTVADLYNYTATTDAPDYLRVAGFIGELSIQCTKVEAVLQLPAPVSDEGVKGEAREYVPLDVIEGMIRDWHSKGIANDSRLADMIFALQLRRPRDLGGELVRFLNGEAPLDGVWFGENHPWLAGRYWWRRFLPSPSRESGMAAKLAELGRYLDDAIQWNNDGKSEDVFTALDTAKMTLASLKEGR